MIEQHPGGRAFDGLAANYERYRVGYSNELFDALENLGFRRGMAVLDAGCGTGLSMEPLAARGMTVTGVDSSGQMLAAAKHAVPGAAVVEAKVEELPFPDRHFDAAVSAQAFHWFDADKAYAELSRVDPLRGGFGAFYRAPFASRTLRVLPFLARLRVDDWIGYERSRASTRDAYGAKLDPYLTALRAELVANYGSPGARIDVRYSEYLYLGGKAPRVS
jgi:ubiquinone/menaquinone biosynthesis C-methylase UbiE